MIRTPLILWIVVGLIVLAVGIWIAQEVGNVGIRRVSQESTLQLQINQPVIPGVPVTLSWDKPMQVPLEVLLRDSVGERVISSVTSNDVNQTAIILPCDITDENATVMLANKANGELLSTIEVTVIPAGQDCFTALK